MYNVSSLKTIYTKFHNQSKECFSTQVLKYNVTVENLKASINWTLFEAHICK